MATFISLTAAQLFLCVNKKLSSVTMDGLCRRAPRSYCYRKFRAQKWELPSVSWQDNSSRSVNCDNHTRELVLFHFRRLRLLSSLFLFRVGLCRCSSSTMQCHVDLRIIPCFGGTDSFHLALKMETFLWRVGINQQVRTALQPRLNPRRFWVLKLTGSEHLIKRPGPKKSPSKGWHTNSYFI